MKRINEKYPTKLVYGELHTIICVTMKDVPKTDSNLLDSQPQNVLSKHW